MQISPDTMRILMEMEAPAEQKIALLKALESDWLSYQPPAATNGINEETERRRNENTKAERKRAADRERIAAKREAERVARLSQEESATVPSASRDVAATVARDTRDPDRDTGDSGPSRTSAQVVVLTSSLRSEAYPPVKPNGLTAPKGPEKARGTRVPDDFCPDLAAAEKAGLTLGQAAAEAEKFLDYWRAVPGAKGRKTDWPATWRNWCRNALDRLPQPRKAHERSHHDAKFDARQANLARALAGADRAARRDWKP